MRAQAGKQPRKGRPTAREPSDNEDEGTEETGQGGIAGPGTAGALRMDRSVRRADLRGVGEVRRSLRELLRPWGRAETAEVAELLTTELVTNALVHTDRGAEVSASLAADRLRVEVRDHVRGHPRPHVPAADDGTHTRGTPPNVVETDPLTWIRLATGRTNWA
ncbi:sterol carrier family protein, partial [Streptomyces sp. NPDC097619]|uniref:sterol carrier family protein n=1 Tax=Streptomyces sp. NPDC097619 TaxID=3157228 RepID=UPI00331FD88E